MVLIKLQRFRIFLLLICIMILKNTYGLTTILSEKSIRQRVTVNNFAGSSLNRKRKLNTISLKQLYEEQKQNDEELNFQSQINLLRIVGYRMPVRTEKDCFSIAPVCGYDWRYPPITYEDLDSAFYVDSLLEHGEKLGYFYEEAKEEKISHKDEEKLLNSLGDSFLNNQILDYNNESSVKNILTEKEYTFRNEDSLLNDVEPIKPILEQKENSLPIEKKLRSISIRTKQKIKKKVIAFSQVYEKLTFLTLTFVNLTTDKQAVKLLAKFLDNCTKQMKDFQYLWVAERQTKNKTFEGNIHFHIITNKYFKIDKYWNYWLKVQEKAGIVPRDKDFKPSSAFDIRRINANNIKAIGQYITKYVTKNQDQFECQVWNCSKKVSMLYTDFYTGYEFIENVERLLERDLESIPAEYCTIYSVPLNRKTLPMYEKLKKKNREIVLNSTNRIMRK